MSLTKPYFEDDAVTIYLGDCREVLPHIQADVTVTDPPYGVGVPYGDGYDDARHDYWDWLRAVMATAREVTPRLIFTHRVTALREITDWDWVGVWNKPGAFGSRLGNSPVLPHWEAVFMYGIHSMGITENYHSDVFDYNPQRAGAAHGVIGREKWNSDLQGAHPCPKPEDLYRTLLLVFSRAGETILDPFMGSGTTLRAAKDLGRKAIGIEIEERYCEIAAKRMSQSVMAL